MSLFLSQAEKEAFLKCLPTHPSAREMYWALLNRVEQRASAPGLRPESVGSAWWFCAAEYLTDAAMVVALKPGNPAGVWLRDVTLSIVRRPESDWVGPAFRNHNTQQPMGHLETAHLSWAVAVVYDLASTVFSPDELEEIKTLLSERAIPMCLRWLDVKHSPANWRGVLSAGATVAACVVNDKPTVDRMLAQYALNADSFQSDGSYGESLQYANYHALHLTLAREALLRLDPGHADRLTLAPWAKVSRWQAASLLYRKPLSGWGSGLRPRSANFNDSAALFRPSADVLLHIAVHAASGMSAEAGLARWLFDQLYTPDFTQGPNDLASFGFYNDFGFLSVLLLPQAVEAITPAEAGLPEVASFSCGDVLVRDRWGGQTVLAIHGGGDPLRGPGHLHGDLNSFILAHREERLLCDPGHSCYRNLIHELEGSTLTHNTCTFIPENQRRMQQARSGHVGLDRVKGELGPPCDRGGRSLGASRSGPVSLVGSEAAALYGAPMESFQRFWILCGSHALFVIDHIRATEPVRTAWHWLLNNRDGELNYKRASSDRMVVRRGKAGMKLFNDPRATAKTEEHAYVHDLYHTKPGGPGEGKPGSGLLVTWMEDQPQRSRIAVHAIAVDSYGAIAGWHLKRDDHACGLEGPGTQEYWQVRTEADATRIIVEDKVSGRSWVAEAEQSWQLRSND